MPATPSVPVSARFQEGAAVIATRLFTAGTEGPASGRILPAGPLPPLFIYWALFAGSVAAFVLSYVIGEAAPALDVVLHVASSVTCGLSWLLARSLFRPPGARRNWPEIMVAILFLTGVLLYAAGSGAAGQGSMLRAFDNVHSLIASTVLLMTFVEAADGAGRGSAPAERRFRFAFLGGYGVLLAVSVIWFRSVPQAGPWEETAQAICACVALIGGTAAVWYRMHHPLAGDERRRPKTRLTGDRQLAGRVAELLESEHIYRDPELKVADLSRRLGHPEYKISQCITGPLGFSNFNRMVNHYRIEEARALLAREDMAGCSILAIAMECGFGSIGPFNRAFKDMAGMTPGQFRASLQRR